MCFLSWFPPVPVGVHKNSINSHVGALKFIIFTRHMKMFFLELMHEHRTSRYSCETWFQNFSSYWNVFSLKGFMCIHQLNWVSHLPPQFSWNQLAVLASSLITKKVYRFDPDLYDIHNNYTSIDQMLRLYLSGTSTTFIWILRAASFVSPHHAFFKTMWKVFYFANQWTIYKSILALSS
jgi:hypothetical protein